MLVTNQYPIEIIKQIFYQSYNHNSNDDLINNAPYKYMFILYIPHMFKKPKFILSNK